MLKNARCGVAPCLELEKETTPKKKQHKSTNTSKTPKARAKQQTPQNTNKPYSQRQPQT